MKLSLDVKLREEGEKTVLGFCCGRGHFRQTGGFGHGIIKRKADQVLDRICPGCQEAIGRRFLRCCDRFAWRTPESVKEVSELLCRFGESAKVYAGGTELLLGDERGFGPIRAFDQRQKCEGSQRSQGRTMERYGSAPFARIISLETSPVLQQKLAGVGPIGTTTLPMFEFDRLERSAAIFVSPSPMPIREYCCWPSEPRWLRREPVRSAKFRRKIFLSMPMRQFGSG